MRPKHQAEGSTGRWQFPVNLDLEATGAKRFVRSQMSHEPPVSARISPGLRRADSSRPTRVPYASNLPGGTGDRLTSPSARPHARRGDEDGRGVGSHGHGHDDRAVDLLGSGRRSLIVLLERSAASAASRPGWSSRRPTTRDSSTPDTLSTGAGRWRRLREPEFPRFCRERDLRASPGRRWLRPLG